MSTHILVPIDGSSPSWNALDYVLLNYEDEKITVLYVVDIREGLSTDAIGASYDRERHTDAIERGENLCKTARKRADELVDLNLADFNIVTKSGHPGQMILKYTENNDVDHIIIGSQERSSLSRILFGSVVKTVACEAPVSVTIVR